MSALSRASSSLSAALRVPRRAARIPLTATRTYKIKPQAKFTAEEQAAIGSMSKARGRDVKKAKVLAQMTYFVLGHPPDKPAVWDNSLLAKIMVTPQKLRASALDSAKPIPEFGAAHIPPQLAYGIGFEHDEQKLLFKYLPKVSETQAWANEQGKPAVPAQPSSPAELDANSFEGKEMTKVEHLARILDLRHASAREIRAENTRRCIRAFSAPDQPNDTGRCEVQAAILTIRIRALWQLMQERGFTGETRRGLRKLVYDRKRMLSYLKRLDRIRFDTLLAQLGVEQAAVEGELMV